MSADATTATAQERRPLAATLRRLETKIAAIDATLVARDTDFRDVQSYMVDNRGDLDPMEMYQNDLFLRDIDAGGAHAMRVRERLVAMRAAPYFARLDFRPEGESVTATHYIGRHTFQDAEGTAVVDWRAPLGGMYYEGELGEAAYEAPAGTVLGALERKRQIKIVDGGVEYAVDTADAVRDQVLLDELARSTQEHMRSVIATIQREQNAIIRRDIDRTLIIQGVAGSGKTTVALHRIAFLLFRLCGTLRAENVGVVSPNGVFAEYVSDVLPELGEEPVVALDLPGIARAQLRRDGLDFRAPLDPTEPGAQAAGERARVKGSAAFSRWLESALRELVDDCFVARDLRLKGCGASAEELRELYDRLAPRPVLDRLGVIAGRLYELDREARPGATTYPRPAEIARELRRMLTATSARALYRELLARDDSPTAYRPPSAKVLEWADVYPYLMVADAFSGLERDDEIRHLVVDEMQDCSPVQYAVLRRIYPCTMTLLGDVDQALGSTERYGIDDLARLFDDAPVMRLDRSYRSTTEIMEFASRFRGQAIATVERHGDAPQTLGFDTTDVETAWLCDVARRFRDGGSGRLAIVARSRVDAEAVHRALSATLDDVALVTADARGALGRHVVVLPVALAKGLEFDEVIVPGVTAQGYGAAGDRALLYIACTRALHRLTLTYSGEPSPHLPVEGGPPGERRPCHAPR